MTKGWHGTMAQTKGRGQIIEKGSDKWLLRIFRGRDANGKKRYSSKVINGSKMDAKRHLTKMLSEVDSGVFVDSSAITLREFIEQWLNDIAKTRVRERTFDQYKWIVENYICKTLGSHKLTDLQAYQVQRFYGDLLNRGLSPRTVRYTHNVLSSALKQAVKWNIIVQNPCDICDLPRQIRKEMKYFSAEEVGRFLETARSSKWFALFLLAIETGMRPEEYFGLQWKDVDFELGVLTVRRALVWRSGGGFVFTEPKTSRSRRSIPISTSLVQALRSHRRTQLEDRMKLDTIYQDFDLVFASEIGTGLMNRNINRRHFQPLLKLAKVPVIRLYDLRHTTATMLLLLGENPKVVSERLGHASVTLTLDTYSHVLPTMQKTATDKLEKMMFGT
jgi:integrase